ncbi:MAG TPA: FAD-dependent oxidoreductase [Gemmataceae bacterium]|jgi:electron transfer flavoprotein-quinone oxidoreductase
MVASQYDVIVVGAGCAGLTAAIGLARAGFTVAVIESAPLPGANGIGGVCFAENLAEPEILGPEGVEALAWERRLIERGCFATDGRRLVGSTYRDPDAFRHCYTVLRPLFDHHLAQIALTHGVALLTDTAVEGLIREGRRVIGVATSRGPLYGDLVFLAEGDAGHLVSREGYDRSSDPRDTPAFLYGLQQVLDLPPGAIEECFRVGPEQGVAHELLLRNPGQAPLNVRGFVCTNRQSVTLSVVLPAENMRQHFDGEPRRLLDWFADMPALRPWWREGRRSAWTARLLRTGGLRDVPYLAEDGLAVGGAAAGLGVDFPTLNTMGPATFTGLLIARAAAQIRAEGGGFDRESLSRHYMEPLRQTRYWRDMEFLQRWPGYVKRSRVLFDQELDLLLDSAAVWARPRRWLPRKLLAWFRLLGRVRWAQWGELRDDLFHASRALRFRDVTPRPALARVLLDGALNAFRDLARKPRPHLPPAGTLRIHYFSADTSGAANMAPALLRRWFGRFQPVLASAGHIVYRNDDTPLSAKMTAMVELLVRQVNLIDLLAVATLGSLTALASTLLDACGSVFRWLGRRRTMQNAECRMQNERQDPSSFCNLHSASCIEKTDPLIHIVWRSTHPQRRADVVRGLPHVCPTGVFEICGEPPDVVQVLVHGDKCIRCEACWRSNLSVDWGHNGSPRLRSAVLSPLVTRLLEAEDRAGLVRPAAPRDVDPWQACARDRGRPTKVEVWDELSRLLDQLDDKLSAFEKALVKGPAAVDRPRSDHLEMLARYAQQLAVHIREVLHDMAWPTGAAIARQQALELAAAMVTKTEERARRTWDGRFAWAVADGRLLRQHHLTGLRRILGRDALGQRRMAEDPSVALRKNWISPALTLREKNACLKHLLADIATRRYLLETLDDAPMPAEETARVELLAALAEEVRDELTTKTAELHALLGCAEKSLAIASHRGEEAYGKHGPALLADAEQARSLLDLPGDWQSLTQRRAMTAEREEILKAEARLIGLASNWRDGSHEPAAEEEVSAGFVREAAHVLAGKLLLLRTHDRLENGLNAELAVVLLRVWLDYAATRLDEFTIIVRDRLRLPVVNRDRPLVEFGSGPPPKTTAEYRAAPSPYTSGDFLLASVDLRQPRLVPEMLSSPEEVATVVGQAACLSIQTEDKQAACPTMFNVVVADLVRMAADLRDHPQNLPRREEILYLAEALAWEIVGRRAHPQTRALDLEMACARLIVTALRQRGAALVECCVILRTLAEEVLPRWRRGGEERVRHLGRDVLELEALKADFRRRLTTTWDVFGEALARNADVQASCFALAEAAAWLKAADSTLGRMAWLSRLCEAEERDEPAARQDLGRRVLAHCHAEIRDRLFRFDEDLAALRRGYYAPHVRAAALLLAAEPECSALPPSSDIERPVRVLVIVEPLPAVLPHADDGERVLESYWALDDGDRAALENALRLRDAAPELVSIEVAAAGPPRVGQALREILSLGIEPVHLLVQDREEMTAERVASVLAAALRSAGPFDLVLGAHRESRLTAFVAEALDIPLAGHAAGVTVQARFAETRVRLRSAADQPLRERPLPAAVLIEAGTSLRPFTVAGYLGGLNRSVQPVTP